MSSQLATILAYGNAKAWPGMYSYIAKEMEAGRIKVSIDFILKKSGNEMVFTETFMEIDLV